MGNLAHAFPLPKAAALAAMRAEFEDGDGDDAPEVVSAAVQSRREREVVACDAHLDDLVRVYPKGVPVAPRGAPRFIY
jgi:hypothetical protein